MERFRKTTEDVMLTIAAPVIGFVAASVTFLLLLLPTIPFDCFHSIPVVYYCFTAINFLAAGFAFVLAGSLIAVERWRAWTARSLIGIGILVFVLVNGNYNSNEGFPAWQLVSAIAGGLLAATVSLQRRHKVESRPQSPSSTQSSP